MKTHSLQIVSLRSFNDPVSKRIGKVLPYLAELNREAQFISKGYKRDVTVQKDSNKKYKDIESLYNLTSRMYDGLREIQDKLG